MLLVYSINDQSCQAADRDHARAAECLHCRRQIVGASGLMCGQVHPDTRNIRTLSMHTAKWWAHQSLRAQGGKWISAQTFWASFFFGLFLVDSFVLHFAPHPVDSKHHQVASYPNQEQACNNENKPHLFGDYAILIEFRPRPTVEKVPWMQRSLSLQRRHTGDPPV